MKNLTCGLVILNEFGEILMGKVTGQRVFDLPKGRSDGDETPVETMVREVYEEFGLHISPLAMAVTDLGEHPYNKEKRIHLFQVVVKKDSIDMDALVCTSFFPHHITGQPTPEINGYEWIPLNQVPNRCSKSMIRVLTKIFFP